VFAGSLEKVVQTWSDPEDKSDEKATKDAWVLNRLEELKREGRTLGNPDQRRSNEVKRAKDHQDHLIDHVAYFAKLVSDERKAHVALGKRVGKMVLAHFAGLKGKEERVKREEERDRKALARWTVREVKKKWKLAITVRNPLPFRFSTCEES